jgi:copper chaperone NosL
MQRYLEKATSFFEIPVDMRSRIAILAAALLLVPVLFLPLWQVQIATNQFPDGLTVNIYADRLEGTVTEERDDLLEINALNYYVGMQPLENGDFVEFKWMPFVLGATVLLAFRVIVLGKMSKLIDLLVFYSYFGLFALWSFYSRLYEYGHHLNPNAQIKLEPFTPPMFGKTSIAHFELSGAPAIGSYLMVVVPIILIAAVCVSRRTWKREHMPSKDFMG